MSRSTARVRSSSNVKSVVVSASVINEALEESSSLSDAQVTHGSATSCFGTVASASLIERVAKIGCSFVGTVVSRSAGANSSHASIGSLAISIGSARISKRNVSNRNAFSSRANLEISASDRGSAIFTDRGLCGTHAGWGTDYAISIKSASVCSSAGFTSSRSNTSTLSAVCTGALSGGVAVVAYREILFSAETVETFVSSIACYGFAARTRFLVEFGAVDWGRNGTSATNASLAGGAHVARVANSASST